MQRLPLLLHYYTKQSAKNDGHALADCSCSSHFFCLCFTAAEKQHFWPRRSFVWNCNCPQWHQDTFLIVVPQNWQYRVLGPWVEGKSGIVSCKKPTGEHWQAESGDTATCCSELGDTPVNKSISVWYLYPRTGTVVPIKCSWCSCACKLTDWQQPRL